MAEVRTTTQINATQLAIELGRVSIRVVGPYPEDFEDPERAGYTFVRSDDVDQATLDAAVGAHVADPDYVDPEFVAPTPEPTDQDRIAFLMAEVTRLSEAVGVTPGVLGLTNPDLQA